jgi:hypothetical protein
MESIVVCHNALSISTHEPSLITLSTLQVHKLNLSCTLHGGHRALVTAIKWYEATDCEQQPATGSQDITSACTCPVIPGFSSVVWVS